MSFNSFTVLNSLWNVFQLVSIPSDVAFHNFFTETIKQARGKINESHSIQLSSEMKI